MFGGGTSYAVSASEFMPGRIIDDEIFYNKDAMPSIQSIQDFINNHTPTCDTWGTGPSGYNSLTKAQYATQVMGWPGPPYVCLQNYYENPTTGDTSFEKGGGYFQGGQSAAQIIWDAAKQYSINPQVLLVMLRKESLNLYSDSWPLKSQYAYAMGYACPDSGPNYSAACSASKKGFYNQVRYAAWQLRYYVDHMGEYNFTPGRVNSIQYNPDPACGTKDVYIYNNATASLYIYTPYTPNDAALNSYPGQAPCGAYGNRNFWFMFQEWFGRTLSVDIVRTTSSPTAYLVSNGSKYLIPSQEVLDRFKFINPNVGFVDQAYIDRLTTGPTLSRIARNAASGDIYLIDSGYKLKFTSCALLGDYALDCNNVPNLSQEQLDKLMTGPDVTSRLNTTDGKLFYIKNGTKRQAYDQASLDGQSMTDRPNTLPDSAINNLPYGTPIIRQDVLVKSSNSSAIYYFRDNKLYYLSGNMFSNPAFSQVILRSLSPESVDKVQKSTSLVGHVVDENGNRYMLVPGGKVAAATLALSSPETTIAAATLAKSPTLNSTNTFLRNSRGSIVYITKSTKHPIPSWADFTVIQPNQSSTLVYDDTIAAIQASAVPAIAPATMIKSAASPRVYITDGAAGQLRYVPSVEIMTALDLTETRSFAQATIDAFPLGSGGITDRIKCGVDYYVGSQGILKRMSPSQLTQYGISDSDFVPLADVTCNRFMKRGDMGSFIRTNDGVIYQVAGGKKTRIYSYQTYTSLGGNTSNTVQVTYNFAQTVPS